ncbi:hypothetical protein [Thiosocius teredinicola]|uniref:hypothetical protein n=1 Tax=Thiosocius teredinicola TaxID=1973002 RepID=UPI002FE4425F
MKRSGLAAVIVLAMSGATMTANADTLLMDSIKSAPANSKSGVQRPRSGTSMATVRSQFGEPSSVKDAVGEPPITRWVYPSYTVYFEHEHVIDTVVHR